MRPQQNNFNNKRGRGRNRSGGGGGGGGGGNAGGGKPQNVLHRNFESTGPDVKVRGNAQHVYEKYLQLARDANSSGDRVMAESYLQHAEHYYRIIAAAQASMTQQQRDQHAATTRANGNGDANGNGSDQDGDNDEPQGATVESTQPPPVQQPAEDDQPVV
jgi:hypothetical protein